MLELKETVLNLIQVSFCSKINSSTRFFFTEIRHQIKEAISIGTLKEETKLSTWRFGAGTSVRGPYK
jgi:hypothetical protein